MQVRGPDGTVVNFPDGTPNGVIHQAMTQYYAVQADKPASGMVDTLNRSIPGLSEVGAGITALGGMADDAMAGRSVDPGRSWQQARAMQQGNVDQFQQNHPVASSLTKGVGLALPVAAGLATGGATAAPALARAAQGGFMASAGRVAAGVGRNALTGATVGGVYGASQPGTLAERGANATNAMLPGAAFGAAIPAAVGVVAGGVRVLGAGAAGADLSTSAGRLAAENIPLTPGQKIGGGVNAFEQKMTSVPLTGDMIQGAMGRGRDALNRAVANRALGPIGETLPAGVKTGTDAVAHVADRLGAAYKGAEGLVTNLTPDAQLLADIKTHAGSLSDLPQETQDQFGKIIQSRVLDPLANGSGSGAQIGGIQSQLGSLASDFSRQGGPSASLGRALDGVSDSVSDLAARQNPDYADAKSAADTGWANFVRMRQAAASAGAKDGVFTPAALKAAVRANDDSVGKGATAKGDALLYRLADDADQVMGSKVGDSGTAGRLMAAKFGDLALGGAAGAGAIANPVAAAGAVGTLGAAGAPYAFMGRGVANAFASADPSLGAQIAARASGSLPSPNVGNAMLPRSVTALSFIPSAMVGEDQRGPQ